MSIPKALSPVSTTPCRSQPNYLRVWAALFLGLLALRPSAVVGVAAAAGVMYLNLGLSAADIQLDAEVSLIFVFFFGSHIPQPCIAQGARLGRTGAPRRPSTGEICDALGDLGG